MTWSAVVFLVHTWERGECAVGRDDVCGICIGEFHVVASSM